MDKNRLKMIVDNLGDIFSSGQGVESISSWQEKSIRKLFKENQVTSEEKKEVLIEFYKEPDDCVTIEEIKWMMEECGVDTLTIQISVID